MYRHKELRRKNYGSLWYRFAAKVIIIMIIIKNNINSRNIA